MNVYRVEFEDEGVYHASYGHPILEEMSRHHTKDFENHPSWGNDGMSETTSLHLAGCEDADKLFEWFRGYWSGFGKTGCVVKIFKISPAWVVHSRSRKQLAFHIEHADLVQTMTIKEFLMLRRSESE